VRSRSIDRAPARVGSGRRTHRSLDRVLGLGKVPHVSRHGGDDAVVVVVVDVDVASHRGGVDGGAPALNLAAPGGVVSEILIDGLYRSMRSRVGFFPASMETSLFDSAFISIRFSFRLSRFNEIQGSNKNNDGNQG